MISEDRIHYRRNILISIIISETIIILAFLLVPDFKPEGIKAIINEPILISEITPQTRYPVHNSKLPPNTPLIRINEAIDAFELLEDVSVNISISEDVQESKIVISNRLYNTIPKLTMEVLPDNKDDQLRGSISFSLKIDKMGRVAEHKIIGNSLGCDTCISRIISAVYKSKWEPALKNGSETEFWVKKSYVFN